MSILAYSVLMFMAGATVAFGISIFIIYERWIEQRSLHFIEIDNITRIMRQLCDKIDELELALDTANGLLEGEDQ